MGDPRDEKIVGWQLGRKITNMRRVVFRCPHGYPVVIESFPIKDGKPFPTLYWLTCPHLRKEVSKLESQGYIKEFEEKLEREDELRKKMKEAHVEIIEKRAELLPEDHPFREILSKVGTGGIKDFTKLKCLHLHLADYLAGVKNPVGEMVWNLVERRFCEEILCRAGEERE